MPEKSVKLYLTAMNSGMTRKTMYMIIVGASSMIFVLDGHLSWFMIPILHCRAAMGPAYRDG